MNLKGLIYRELGEGLTEKELAAAVGVSPGTIDRILANKSPKEPAVWHQFAKYFRMDADFLRAGAPRKTPGRSRKAGIGPTVPMRKVPLVSWEAIGRMAAGEANATVHDSDAMLETDVQGPRAFALRVKDDSMNPLFGEGEIIFVNPDLECEPGHYVVAGPRRTPEQAVLRELRTIGTQYVLHPLNRRRKDTLLTHDHFLWGRVVRLRKDL
ncbi:S24 family peptidase [Nitrospira tepida]|uniref:S24 family peptidase n=1 Tax=Nitrospira tepida TaxID=2973512 RepID=A0AA86N0A4_9BACT|nr:XRE family transcriptional regulator [Nitrospira tepida]CAI4032365.1 S24 family peptidase [Nitrospira tepida]